MEENKKRFFKLDIFFWLFLLAVAGYFFYRSTPATAPSENDLENVNTVSSTVISLPDGVSVEDLEDGTRLVKNEKDGYSVKVDKDKKIEKTIDSNLSISEYNDENNEKNKLFDYRVVISSKDSTLIDLDVEVKNKCKNNIDCKSYKIENKNVNGVIWKKIVYFGDYVGAGWPEFVYNKDGKSISLFFQFADDDFINYTLSNFSF